MAKAGYDNAKQPKSLIWHPPKFPDHMMQTTGVLDSFDDFDHSFLKWTLAMQYYKQMIGAYKRGMIGRGEYFYGIKKNAVELNLEPWKKMQHIWYYGLDILNQYDASDTTIIAWCPLYKPIDYLKDHQKLVHLPSLKKMNPVGQLADETLGVKIRELVPLNLAWEGHDVATMVTTGNWFYSYGNSQVPMFSRPEDVALSDAYTYWVSRDFFSSAIDILEREFNDNELELYLDNHELIQTETIGYVDQSMQNTKSVKKSTALV